MVSAPGSEYLQWWKTRTPAKYNLGFSGVLPCSASDLGAGNSEIEINAPATNGPAPLMRALAGHCRVESDCIVAASGTSMANFIALGVLIQPGDEVLIESPAYEPLLAAARYLGAEVKQFPRPVDVSGFLSNRTRLIVVTNLHNPTCARLDPLELMKLAEAARGSGARVLVDEVYLECRYEQARSAFCDFSDFICTGSLTKAYGLGGLRCGWILAEPDLARRMWHFKDLIDPGMPYATEQLSVVAFRKLDQLAARAKAILERNRAILAEFLGSTTQLEMALPDYGTCVFPRLKSGDADRLFDFLHSRFDTDVVPGRFFGQPDHFRLGIGVETGVLQEGLQRLHTALQAYHR